MGESPCFMHLFPPDELLPSQDSSTNNCQIDSRVKEEAAPTPPVVHSTVATSGRLIETQGSNSLSLQQPTTMRVSRPLASFTYALGNSLYVPLTSRCNTKTLPESRGPNFLLSPQVVSTLCRVRDAEHGTQQWEFWCNYLDTQEGPQKLPPAFEITNELPPPIASSSGNGDGANAVERYPRVKDLLKEIEKKLESSKDGWDSIVFAGEGEPTMRLDDLLYMAKSIQDSQRSKDTNLVLRLNTNGLVQPSSSTSDKSIPQQIFDSGVTKMSIALMTADPHQYETLMDPVVDNAHMRICKFIKEATAVNGLEVETTAVEQDGVDKEATEALSESLHVTNSLRWRPYFC